MDDWNEIGGAPSGVVVEVYGHWERPEERLCPMVTTAMFDRGIWWRNNDGYDYTVQCHPTHWRPHNPPSNPRSE